MRNDYESDSFPGFSQTQDRDSLVEEDPGNEFEFKFLYTYNGDVAKVQTCIKQTPTEPTLKKIARTIYDVLIHTDACTCVSLIQGCQFKSFDWRGGYGMSHCTKPSPKNAAVK